MNLVAIVICLVNLDKRITNCTEDKNPSYAYGGFFSYKDGVVEMVG